MDVSSASSSDTSSGSSPDSSIHSDASSRSSPTSSSSMKSRQKSGAESPVTQHIYGGFTLAEKLAMQEKINQLEKELKKRNALDLREENVWERVAKLEVENEELKRRHKKILKLVYERRELRDENACLKRKLEKEKVKKKHLQLQIDSDNLKKEVPGQLDPQFAEYAQSSPSPDHNEESSTRSASPDSLEEEAVSEVSEYPSTSGSYKMPDRVGVPSAGNVTNPSETGSKIGKKVQEASRRRLLSNKPGIPEVPERPSTSGSHKKKTSVDVTGSSETGSKAVEKMQKTTTVRILSDDSDGPPEQEAPEIPTVSYRPSIYGGFRRQATAGAPSESTGNVTELLGMRSKAEEKKVKTIRVWPREDPQIPEVSKYPSTSGPYKTSGRVSAPSESAGNVTNPSETGSKIREKKEKTVRVRVLSDELEIPKASEHPSTSGPQKRKARSSDARAEDVDEMPRTDSKAGKLNRKKKGTYRRLFTSSSGEPPEEEESEHSEGLVLHKPRAEDNKKAEKTKIEKEAKQQKSEEKKSQEGEVKMEPPTADDPENVDIPTEMKSESQRQTFRALKKLHTNSKVAKFESTPSKRARAQVNYAEEED